MLLESKVAVVYGGGGPIGGAMARAFAREGARVFLASRSAARLDKVAADIRAAGGAAETTSVDALDERAVDGFVDAVAARAGSVDISANVIGYDDVQKPLTELSVEDFLQPVTNAMRTHFLTTRAAARHMIPRRSGVVLAFGGGGPQTMAGMGGFKVALDALESLRRQWAVELGRHGIRVLTMKTGGVPESIPGDVPGRADLTAMLTDMTLLNRTATLDDVGDVAAFLACDRARTMTAADINISCGAILD